MSCVDDSIRHCKNLKDLLQSLSIIVIFVLIINNLIICVKCLAFLGHNVQFQLYFLFFLYPSHICNSAGVSYRSIPTFSPKSIVKIIQ